MGTSNLSFKKPALRYSFSWYHFTTNLPHIVDNVNDSKWSTAQPCSHSLWQRQLPTANFFQIHQPPLLGVHTRSKVGGKFTKPPAVLVIVSGCLQYLRTTNLPHLVNDICQQPTSSKSISHPYLECTLGVRWLV